MQINDNDDWWFKQKLYKNKIGVIMVIVSTLQFIDFLQSKYIVLKATEPLNQPDLQK